MPPRRHGRVGLLALSAGALVVAAGCGSSGPGPLVSNTVAPNVATTSPTTPPAEQSTSVPATLMTVAGATAQASPGSLLITLDGHLSSLPAALAGARLTTPTQFTLTLEGIRLTTPLNATFPTGQVATVTSSATPAGTSITATLRTPASGQSVAVGGGNEVDVTFS